MFDTAISVPSVYGDRPLLDGIRAAGEQGVDGVEFFDWENNDVEEVVAACEDAGVSLAATLSTGAGSVIETRDTPALSDPDSTDEAIADIERSIDVAESIGCPNLIVTTGPDQEGVDRTAQRAAIVEGLSAVAPRAEEAGVTVVLEPLNTRVDHPGYFLTSSDDAFDIIASVDSPSVKVLFDVYHQQISEGDVTRRLTENLERVGHVHVADNPGRAEPGTGEIDYGHVFQALVDGGYDGFVGFEFMPRSDPEPAVRGTIELVDECRRR